MKNNLILILILVLTGFDNIKAQDSLKFTLPIPSKNEIAIFKKTSNEIGYDYLKNYFKLEGKRVDIAKSVMLGDNSICDWKQKFSNGIYYHFNNCGEGGDIVTISFPKSVNETEIYNLVNSLFKISDNKWNKSKTKYEPKEGLAGCYYEIIKTNQYIVLSYYCGC